MSTNQQNINLSEIDVKFNQSVEHTGTNDDDPNQITINVDAPCVDNEKFTNNWKEPVSTSNEENRKYLYKANYNSSNRYIIRDENQSEGGVSIIKTKESCNLSGLDCSKESLWRCGRCMSSTVTKHSSKCIVILACIAVVLFIIIIILISTLPKSSDEKEVTTKAVCDYNPCMNNGTCSEIKDTFICTCPDGFSGTWCETTPCSDSHCLNGGKCITEGPVGVCKCENGFSGKVCEVTPCTNVTCVNGGRCNIIGSGFKCTCPEGASGIYCEETPCRGIRCLNGGTCLFRADVSTCACPYTYYGRACEKYCDHGARFYSCTFEDNDGKCFLINTGDDDFDWTKHAGSTPSMHTGPTSAAEGRNYMYIEASSPAKEGHIARLVSDQKFSTCVRCLRFSYHMYGQTVGKLNIYHGATSVWTRTGNIGNEWKHVFVDIDGGVNKSITFEAIRGTAVTGDIAIDNVWFSPGSC